MVNINIVSNKSLLFIQKFSFYCYDFVSQRKIYGIDQVVLYKLYII